MNNLMGLWESSVRPWCVFGIKSLFFFFFYCIKKYMNIGTSYKVCGERVKTETGLYDPVVS
jgi:hypothetical protein